MNEMSSKFVKAALRLHRSVHVVPIPHPLEKCFGISTFLLDAKFLGVGTLKLPN